MCAKELHFLEENQDSFRLQSDSSEIGFAISVFALNCEEANKVFDSGNKLESVVQLP